MPNIYLNSSYSENWRSQNFDFPKSIFGNSFYISKSSTFSVKKIIMEMPKIIQISKTRFEIF